MPTEQAASASRLAGADSLGDARRCLESHDDDGATYV